MKNMTDLTKEEILKLLYEIKKEVEELKGMVSKNAGKPNTTKITVIGNRPQKTTNIKGVDSGEDFTL
jgi:hypothetical protein